MTHYLLGAVVRLAQRLFKGGISKEERGRQRSIAAATAPLHGVPLSPEDAELVAAHHEIALEYRTGEIPKIGPRRPTVREVARKYRRPARHSAKRHALPKSRPRDPLSDPLTGELSPAVMLPGPPPAWRLESFTTGWTRADLDRMIADAKTEASR